MMQCQPHQRCSWLTFVPVWHPLIHRCCAAGPTVGFITVGVLLLIYLAYSRPIACPTNVLPAGPSIGFISGYLLSTPSAPTFQPPAGQGWWNNFTVEKGGFAV